MEDDPIFSVEGDLVFNWGYSYSGVRVALTGGHLSDVDSDDQNTHGLGGHIVCDPRTGVSHNDDYRYEIDIICPGSVCFKVQGTDHGGTPRYRSNRVPAYGNYAIYVSSDASTFPTPGNQLQLEINQCSE